MVSFCELVTINLVPFRALYTDSLHASIRPCTDVLVLLARVFCSRESMNRKLQINVPAEQAWFSEIFEIDFQVFERAKANPRG
jgi:hypothetical protein